MKAIPIKKHGRRQGWSAAVKAGITLAVVAAVFLEVFPVVHSMKSGPETSAVHGPLTPSPPAPSFVPNPMPSPEQLEKMERADPSPTF